MRLLEILRTLLVTGPEEVRFFARIAVYALVVGIVYWFLTYETAGTVLLIGFGLCALFAGLILGHGTRGVASSRIGSSAGPAAGGDPERPLLDESGRLPAPGLAPLGMGFGLAMAALGVAFGPWLILAGLVLVAWAGWGWLRSAMAEHAAVAADDASPVEGGPTGPVGGPAGVTAGRLVPAEPVAPADPDPVVPGDPGPGTVGGSGTSGGHAIDLR